MEPQEQFLRALKGQDDADQIAQDGLEVITTMVVAGQIRTVQDPCQP